MSRIMIKIMFWTALVLSALAVLYPPARRWASTLWVRAHKGAIGHIKRQAPTLPTQDLARARRAVQAHKRALRYEYDHHSDKSLRDIAREFEELDL